MFHPTLPATSPRYLVAGISAFAVLCFGLLLLASGHHHSVPVTTTQISVTPNVHLVHPELQTLTREVGQPSFVEAYEQTSIYAKLPGYIEKWRVDIGDLLKKDELMATIFIPELLEEHESKKALVEQDKALVDQSHRLVEVAEGNYSAAIAQVAVAKANVGKYDAAVQRWTSEVERLTRMANENVIDQQVLDESTRQLQADTAARQSAIASVQSAEANQVACAATLSKSKVDVGVADARLKVAISEERRLIALVGYTQLTAPYDGVVVVRNANTGDFVLPATGDPSASSRSADQAASRATPVYVVARTDIVRVYVDVPEGDANNVHKGTKATVEVRALSNDPIPASVTRTSWALHEKSRTLRAEIDLPNVESRLLPGMYAYGKVMIERNNVRVLPRSAVVELGEQAYCYVYKDGKSIRVAVQTGMENDDWIEVTGKQAKPASSDLTSWAEFTGKEDVIVGDLTELSDGLKVNVVR